MVTTRMTVVEHAKQLVSHGAHAADIEVVEGLLAELEKSKNAMEKLQQFTRKQFGLVQLSEPLRNLQPSPAVIDDVIASVRKLQDAAHEFEVFRNQWKVDNPDLVDPTKDGHTFEYVSSYNSAFRMNGGGLLAIPELEQYDDAAPKGEATYEMVKSLRPEKVREGVYIASPMPLTSMSQPYVLSILEKHDAAGGIVAAGAPGIGQLLLQDALDILETRDSEGNLTSAVVTTSMPALSAALSLGPEPLVLDSLSAISKSQESNS